VRPGRGIRDSSHFTSAAILVVEILFIPLPLLFLTAPFLLRTLEGSPFLTPLFALFLFRPLLVDDVDDTSNKLDDSEYKCDFADSFVL
jgi:hypothetical protein